MKKYVCIRELTIDGKKVEAGTPIKESQLTKKTITQYMGGGILSLVAPITPQEDTGGSTD